MALPISVTYTFATATSAIPLSQLDANFTTVVNGINGIGNGTNSLSNVSITGGNVVVTTANATTGNFTTVNSTTSNVSGNETVGGNLTITGGLVPSSSFLRNRIINGAMVIDQRNAGAAVTVNTNGAYFPVDRFYGQGQNTDGVYTLQQVTDGPSGFVKSLKATVTTADTSLGVTQYYNLNQTIEGFNCGDLGWGTASAQTVTLSFWVKSSVTGTFSGAFNNSANNRSYPFTYVINSTNTWEYKTVVVPGDTTGTWLTDNGAGIKIFWSFGTGSTYSGTSGSWSGALYIAATGGVNLMATNAATWQITGVQLEVGSVATPFERRLYGQELELCQRYYQKSYSMSVVPGTVSQAGAYMNPYAVAGNTLRGTVMAKVNMRTAPTVTTYNPETGTSGYWCFESSGATNQAPSGVTFISEYSWLMYSTASPAAGNYYIQYTASAEL